MFKKLCLRLIRSSNLYLLVALAATLPPRAMAAEDYLQPEQAFQFSAVLSSPRQVTVTYKIADGYYMYRERFQFKAAGATLGQPMYPPGKVKFDETFQKNVETYRHSVQIVLPVEASTGFVLTATGQGCADAGLCYAPMDSEAKFGAGGGLLAAAKGIGTDPAGALPDSPAQPLAGSASSPAATPVTEMGKIESALKSGRLLLILPLFMLLGLGLAFTPCVLPMVPILSSIIIGEGTQVGRGRGFLLSLTYSLGMAIVYTALGVGAGMAGEGLAATLQNPWILGAFALLMVALSLSMFGVYQLQVPPAIQQKLMAASDRQRSGKLLGVFVMGALSALIVGPCVAAPLAGALVYISQTRDVLIGGSALFAMAIGMSVPLLMIGFSAGTLLPRAGAWMDQVKRFFGVLMLGVALWMVSPVIPPVLQMLGWAAIGIGYGMMLLARRRDGWFLKAVGVIFAVFGMVQLVGAATGGRDVFEPLAQLSHTDKKTVSFTRVRSVAELDAILRRNPQQIAMLDFYADWCVSCKEMEKFTFADPKIEARLAQLLLLQADVTANNGDDKALLKRFGLFGPPGIIFFSKGNELPNTRVIGFQNTDRFANSLTAVEQH